MRSIEIVSWLSSIISTVLLVLPSFGINLFTKELSIKVLDTKKVFVDNIELYRTDLILLNKTGYKITLKSFNKPPSIHLDQKPILTYNLHETKFQSSIFQLQNNNGNFLYFNQLSIEPNQNIIFEIYTNKQISFDKIEFFADTIEGKDITVEKQISTDINYLFYILLISIIIIIIMKSKSYFQTKHQIIKTINAELESAKALIEYKDSKHQKEDSSNNRQIKSLNKDIEKYKEKAHNFEINNAILYTLVKSNNSLLKRYEDILQKQGAENV